MGVKIEKYGIDFETLQECRVAFLYILGKLSDGCKKQGTHPAIKASEQIFGLYNNSFKD